MCNVGEGFLMLERNASKKSQFEAYSLDINFNLVSNKSLSMMTMLEWNIN
jgi:hypothetical protein